MFLDRFDDIQDEAIMRNGFPVTHSVYGLHYSINAANYLQFIACEKLINLHPMVISSCIMSMYNFEKLNVFYFLHIIYYNRNQNVQYIILAKFFFEFPACIKKIQFH